MDAFLFLALTAIANAALHARLNLVSDTVDYARFDQFNPTSQSFKLRVTLTNVDTEAASIFRWLAPVESSLWADVLSITNENGEEVEYSGKRPLIDLEMDGNFITLAPGVEITNVIDVTFAYIPDTDGTYSITIKQLDDELAPVYAAANTVEMTFKDTVAMKRAYKVMLNTEDTTSKQAAFVNCTSNQRSLTQSGHNRAIQHTASARRALANTAHNSLMQRWFGNDATTSTLRTSLQNCWGNVANTLSGVRYHCCPHNSDRFGQGCGDRNCGPSGLFAYVYSSDTTRTQHMCTRFFNVNQDTRAETVTHEQTHFNFACATRDWAYGTRDCLDLARNNPPRARNNADNHCFFGLEAFRAGI